MIRNLDHADMVALSGMFRRWAIYERCNTPEQNTRLIEWSADFERLAGWVGPKWRASDPSDKPVILKFMASVERHHSNVINLDDVRALFIGFPDPPAIVPCGSLYAPSRGWWKTPDGLIYDHDGELVDQDPAARS